MSKLKPRDIFRWQMGMQAELILLVFLVLLPLLSLEVSGIVFRFRQAIRHELHSSQELAETIGTAFQHYLASLWDLELAIGTAIASSLPSDEVDKLMNAQLKAHPTVDSISWVSPSGIVLKSTLPGAVGFSCADREHIQRVMNGEEEVVSGLVANRVNNTYALFVVRAIRLHDRLVGIVVATVDPDKLGLVLTAQRTGQSNFALVDNQGMVVFRSNSPNLPLSSRQLSSSSPGRQVLQSGRAYLLPNYTSTIDGILRMGVFIPLPNLGWVSSVTAPTNEVLKSARAEAVHSSIILTFLIALSIFAAHFLAHRFLRPIRALEQASLAISQGDLTPRVALTGSRELVVAANAFDQMADRIQHLESERARFLQIAAHELRNPMATIKGACSLLRLQLSNKATPDSEAMHDVRLLEHGIDTMAALMDEIIDAFRLQEGNFLLKMEPAHLSDVIHNSLEPFLFLDPHHRFVFEDGPSATVMGDSRRLENVFRNLVGNAAKYSPKETTIRVRLETRDGLAIISVHDHGRGIPPEDLTNLFKPFYRGSQAAQDTEGMGLGLYICENIITRHGGRIRVESQEGKGTTFFVELPLYEPPAV